MHEIGKTPRMEKYFRKAILENLIRKYESNVKKLFSQSLRISQESMPYVNKSFSYEQDISYYIFIFYINMYPSDLIQQQFGDNSTTLDSLLVLLRQRVMGLKDGNKNVSAKVTNAKMHADDLSNQAAILESLIRDTRNFSDSAVRAAKVYSNIVQAILEALAAARQADTTAKTTNLKVFPLYFSLS